MKPPLDYLEVIDSTTFDRDDLAMPARIDIRSLFRLDAAFEAAFGLVLTVGGSSAWLTRTDIPVSRGVLIAVGASFLMASAFMVWYIVRAPRRVLFELAVGNGAMAAAGLAWLIADQGFSGAGAAILATAVGWKFAISALQLYAMRSRTVAG